MMLLVTLHVDMSTPSYPQRTGKKPLRAKTAALHNTLPLIVHMHLIKTLCQNIAEKEQAKKKRKAYDQDLRWNHYRRKNMGKKKYSSQICCVWL